jgi:hypothetical protein
VVRNSHDYLTGQVDFDLNTGMHLPDAKCPELMEQTADALSNDVLKLLFVSVQQGNLELCMRYATQE